MALSFIILTLLIAGSIIAGSYSMYLPFFINMQQSTQQLEAYYMARAAMERGQLVLEYHPLGFAGSGGFNDDGSRGPSGESTIAPYNDMIKMGWTTNNQEGYDKNNALYANNLVKIYLGYDNTSNPEHYYQNIVDYNKYAGTDLSIDIQIPLELKNTLGELDSNICADTCDIDGDTIYDDVLIQRDRQGQEGRGIFTILPYTQINIGSGRDRRVVNYNQDTNIRESIINTPARPTLLFTNTFNPIAQNDLPDSWSGHNRTGDGFSGIQNQTFSDLLTNSDIEYNILGLSMPHPAVRIDNKIYPYMHYKINGRHKIASPVNTIQAYAQTQQSTINIKATKPNILSQQKGSFTIDSSIDEQ